MLLFVMVVSGSGGWSDISFVAGAHALRCDVVRWDATNAEVVDDVYKGNRERAGAETQGASSARGMDAGIRMRNAVACGER